MDKIPTCEEMIDQIWGKINYQTSSGNVMTDISRFILAVIVLDDALLHEKMEVKINNFPLFMKCYFIAGF
jgi:hypothetical protein